MILNQELQRGERDLLQATQETARLLLLLEIARLQKDPSVAIEEVNSVTINQPEVMISPPTLIEIEPANKFIDITIQTLANEAEINDVIKVTQLLFGNEEALNRFKTDGLLTVDPNGNKSIQMREFTLKSDKEGNLSIYRYSGEVILEQREGTVTSMMTSKDAQPFIKTLQRYQQLENAQQKSQEQER